MKLTIVAATGGIGREVLAQSLAAGHDVTAVVRDANRLPAGVDGARVVETDLSGPDLGALRDAVAGANAVLSGLGARVKTDSGIATRGTQAIVDAMRTAGALRLVVVSAAPIGTVASPARPRPPKHDPGDGFFMRHLIGRIPKVLFREHYADLAEMEDVVRASRLDWSIVRPPKLTDKPLTGSYRTAVDRNIVGGWSVPRADVAHLMLAALDEPAWVGHTVGVAS